MLQANDIYSAKINKGIKGAVLPKKIPRLIVYISITGTTTDLYANSFDGQQCRSERF